jgi:N-acetylneuraminic acid mutarotase
MGVPRRFRWRTVAASSLLAAVVASCGGGGGGGGNGGSGPPPMTAAAPTITTQPISASVAVGSAASFTVAASGNGTLTYQWRLNGNALSGATSATLALASVGSANAGSYNCVVTDTLSGTTAATTSTAAALTVVASPGSAVVSAESAVLPSSGGHIASTTAQAGASYTWSVANGTITAGQGTPQVTYTSGKLGQLRIVVTASNTAGMVVAIKNVVVVSSVPVVSIFAQSAVLPGSINVLASAPAGTNQSYAWTLQGGSASASISGSVTTATLSYGVGPTPGTYQISVNVSGQDGSAPASRTLSVVQNTFLKDPRDMAQRSLHTATLLNDGRVLFAGGDAGVPEFGALVPAVGSQSNVIGTAELFDPVTMTYALVGSLLTPRSGHAATLLNDGRVLVTGGWDSTGTALVSAEIYDPGSEGWSAAPSMASARALPSATLLADGRVLVTGGVNTNGVTPTVEIYDPAANAWSSAGTMLSPRVLHSETLLPNGQVLVAGGRNVTGNLASAEIYDPATNRWRAAASLPGPVVADGAVVLASGKVLQMGGNVQIYDSATDSWQPSLPVSGPNNVNLGGISSQAPYVVLLPDGRALAAGAYFGFNFGSAIYDPIAQQWSNIPVTGNSNPPPYIAGSYSSVTALQDGRVLAQGGVQSTNNLAVASYFETVSNTALFDPTLGSWSVGGSRAHGGAYAASGVLGNGQVLVTGGGVRGLVDLTAVSAADLFNPTTNTWTAAAAMMTTRQQHTATVLQSGKMLVTGGNYSSESGAGEPPNVFSSAELYDPVTNTWSAAGTMSSPRYQHTASLLHSGLVLAAGGNNLVGTCSCTTFVSSADIYNPITNSWTPTGSLVTARYAHTATVLADGRVLAAGGFGGATSTLQSGGAALASAEIYDSATGTWSATGSMTTARMKHTATLLSSGRVLVVGGRGNTTTPTAEVFDPTSGTWTAVASMSTARESHSAVMLPDGTVLIVGGLNDTSSAVFGVASAERYDPIAGKWSAAGAMVTARQHFVLNVLGDGRVLLGAGSPNLSGLPEFYK